MRKGLLFNIIRNFIIDEIDELLLIVEFKIGSDQVFLCFLLLFEGLNSVGEVFDRILQNVRLLRISNRFPDHFCLIQGFLMGRNES